ncbi:MAG: translational GTPase TypA [Betaproteobacteria bacterium]|nr:translational GTPase TypA [Betaproteobacteria bacterium]MDE2209728.1 translational GTPase TypA [Betaproteobacteria bacterium]
MTEQRLDLRNIAIIAHVDHGKTTLVDKLLVQAGTFARHQHVGERMMDSNDIERERGITIFAKNCAIRYASGETITHINIVDTPGHADFGGEVERVLGMVDGVLLLVDAVEGPMPQTRFVTLKALALGLRPIVVVNKIDRPGARPEWVVNQTFELFDRLGASDEQLDFPVVYASALNGWATLDVDAAKSPQPASPAALPPEGEVAGPGLDMRPLFETILRHVPAPAGDVGAPLQFQVSALDYSSYVGRLGIGRIRRGSLAAGQEVAVLDGPLADGTMPVRARVGQIFMFEGLNRVPVERAAAGDIVLVTGIEDLTIGTTLAALERPEALPPIAVDEPTLSMYFQVNTSPLAGREGKYVTSRNLRDRLARELLTNMALRVDDTGDTDAFQVSGRGELHLTILIENMRREGYELAASRPRVVTREIAGEICEPWESLSVDVEEQHQGAVMEALGVRRGELTNMESDSLGRTRLEYRIPARGLIGFQGEFMNLTRGTGLMSHVFDSYAPVKGDIPERRNGVLISQEDGEAVAYALWKLQERGRMFVSPGDKLYEGMVIGIHSRDNDLVVNPIKGKQLTNVRASGKDDAIMLTPPIALTLEYAVEFIADDELVEVTPKSIRIRKRHLKEHERKRAGREAAAA